MAGELGAGADSVLSLGSRCPWRLVGTAQWGKHFLGMWYWYVVLLGYHLPDIAGVVTAKYRYMLYSFVGLKCVASEWHLQPLRR